jgi:hypothetical protein
MNRILTAMLLCGLAAGLYGCYVVSPYAYPAYAPTYPPPYRPPTYVPPSPGASVPPRPGGPAAGPPPSSATPSSEPGASGSSQGPVKNCQTVTVEGHYETHVRQSGQQETIWIPTRAEQICQ